jgi:hypothetical protein
MAGDTPRRREGRWPAAVAVPETSTRILTVLRRTATVLQDRKRPFALVGGLAVSVRVEPRFTRDIDLAVAVANDANASPSALALGRPPRVNADLADGADVIRQVRDAADHAAQLNVLHVSRRAQYHQPARRLVAQLHA